ncbi:MAG: DUF4065 domain-containing protein [Spiroplasma sp.]|nr:DUF4065 domain-containing protein [Spiroplasma sp.]
MAKLNYMDVAKYLYQNTNNNMSNLKLQKMMFFAYIKYYEKYGEELFDDEFEAWVYGPVLPDLYYSFYRLFLIEDNKDDQNIKDKNIKDVLNEVIKEYDNKGAFELVKISHEHFIWQKARNGLDEFEPSNNKLNIKKHLNENIKTKIRK